MPVLPSADLTVQQSVEHLTDWIFLSFATCPAQPRMWAVGVYANRIRTGACETSSTSFILSGYAIAMLGWPVKARTHVREKGLDTRYVDIPSIHVVLKVVFGSVAIDLEIWRPIGRYPGVPGRSTLADAVYCTSGSWSWFTRTCRGRWLVHTKGWFVWELEVVPSLEYSRKKSDSLSWVDSWYPCFIQKKREYIVDTPLMGNGSGVKARTYPLALEIQWVFF